MEIRYADMGDLPAIMEIERRNFPEKEQLLEEAIAFYLEASPQTCLLAEMDGAVLGYVLSIPVKDTDLTDEIFERHPLPDAPYLAITSLSIAPVVKRQGLGTLLLAALKEVAVQADYQAIALTCHEELISYYEMNGFEDQGLSQSQLGGQVWYDMVWWRSSS